MSVFILVVFFSYAVCFLKNGVLTMLDMCQRAFLSGHRIEI